MSASASVSVNASVSGCEGEGEWRPGGSLLKGRSTIIVHLYTCLPFARAVTGGRRVLVPSRGRSLEQEVIWDEMGYGTGRDGGIRHYNYSCKYLVIFETICIRHWSKRRGSRLGKCGGCRDRYGGCSYRYGGCRDRCDG